MDWRGKAAVVCFYTTVCLRLDQYCAHAEIIRQATMKAPLAVWKARAWDRRRFIEMVTVSLGEVQVASPVRIDDDGCNHSHSYR